MKWLCLCSTCVSHITTWCSQNHLHPFSYTMSSIFRLIITASCTFSSKAPSPFVAMWDVVVWEKSQCHFKDKHFQCNVYTPSKSYFTACLCLTPLFEFFKGSSKSGRLQTLRKCSQTVFKKRKRKLRKCIWKEENLAVVVKPRKKSIDNFQLSCSGDHDLRS